MIIILGNTKGPGKIEYTPEERTARVNRLKLGVYSFGCESERVYSGTPECPVTPQHNHDIFCERPRQGELILAGVAAYLWNDCWVWRG